MKRKKKTETRERERRIESINSRSSGCNSGGGNNKIIKQNRLRKSTHNIYIYRKRMQLRRRRKKKETGVGREKKKTRRVCERARTGRTFFADGATLSQSWRRPFRPSAAPIESGPHKTRKKKPNKRKQKQRAKEHFQESISFVFSSRYRPATAGRRRDAVEKKRRIGCGTGPDIYRP